MLWISYVGSLSLELGRHRLLSYKHTDQLEVAYWPPNTAVNTCNFVLCGLVKENMFKNRPALHIKYKTMVVQAR
jgi:hypothetical protein